MRKLCWLFLFIQIFLAGCADPVKKEELPDAYDRGTIHISCDESFKPVIDEHVKVYEADFPSAKIIVHYKPEAECLKDFDVDSITMVIATRGFSVGEKKRMNDSLGVGPEKLVIAHDLIAVIVHPSSNDTIFTIQEIRDLLTGKSKTDLIPVFDGTRATSTVRFMVDSVLKGESFAKTVAAANSSIEVIDYVSRTKNAVGFVGYSWIGNQDDTTQEGYRKKVKTAWLESTDSVGGYIQPSQFFIYSGSYPLVRDLVYTLKEKHTGLGHGFAFFLESMRGQLIFRRAYIMPVILPNYMREAILKDNTLNSQLKDTINK